MNTITAHAIDCSLKQKAGCLLIAILCSALLIIWPIPHTIAARQILLVLLLIALLGNLGKEASKALRLIPLSIIGTYLALVGWILIHSLFIAVDKTEALDGLGSDWLRFSISLFTAYLLGYYLYTRRHSVLANSTRFALFIFVALVLPFVVHLLALYTDAMFINTEGRRLMALTEGPDKVSYLTNLTLSVCLSTIAYLIVAKNKFKLWIVLTVLAASVLVFASQLFAFMRNGIICSSLISLVAVIFIGSKSQLTDKTKWITVASVLAVVLTAVYFQSQDQRWKSFSETLPIALDTKNNLRWLDNREPMPLLEDGSAVEGSAYLRIAWIKEGMILIAENPWGTGLSRQAFGYQLMQKYGVEDPSTLGSLQSHSGFIDIFLAIGIPGGLLLYLFFASMILYGMKGSSSNRLIIPGLGLVLVTLDFGTRSVLDSILRDHMFEMFLFCSSLFVAYLSAALSEENTASSPRI